MAGRWALAVVGGLLLLGVVLAGLHVQSLGFPDGHLTELDRFYDGAAPWVLPPWALWALVHLVLGASSLPFRRPRLTAGVLGLDVLLGAVFLAAHATLTEGLDHGAGG